MISSDRSPNFFHGIAEDLDIAIVTWEATPEKNQFLVEGELCKHYGVSRSILS